MLRRLHLTSVSSIPQKELDISILTVFSSPESIGIYRVAKNFVVALWSFVDGINLVIFPQITELYLRDNFKELRKLIIKISLSCLLLAIVVIIAAYSLLPFLIEIIFIEDFTDAHGLSMIMFLGSLFWLPLIWVYPLAISAEKTKLILFSTLTTGCILTILYVLSIQTFDIRGVSIVYGLAPGMLSTILLIGLLLDSKHRSNYR